MKRITLTMVTVFAGAVSAAGAQNPTPPVRPAPASRATTPAVAPVAPNDREWILEQSREQSMEARRQVEAARELSRIDIDRLRDESVRAAEMSREMNRAAIADAREATRAAIEASRDANWAAVDAAREHIRAVDAMRDFAYEVPTPALAPMPAMAPMPVMAPMAAMAPMPVVGGFGYAGDGIRAPRFPASLGQGDPADSLYKTARDALNAGNYGSAARMFADIQKRYPKTSYQTELQYYEAMARYKIGTTEELRAAAKLLEPLAERQTASSSEYGRRYTSDSEIVALYARVNGVLAQRGDRDAADKVATLASQRGPAATCDREDIQVKVEAMNALTQMDAASSTKMLRGVLDRKDECSVELRRNAVFMLGRRGDAEAANLIANTAKNDPSTSVRAAAISWLPKLQGDAGVSTLEEILRTEQDEQVQRSVVQTLMSSDNQKARSSMRALIDRKDVPVTLRTSVLSSFNADRSTPDDAAYLRNNYSKIDNDRVKQSVIGAIARIGGAENEQWLLRLANNPNEPSQLRSIAISRLVNANSISIADLSKLYDNSDSYDMRRQIVSALGTRKEAEATDKLIDIVKNSTVSSIRSQAINALLSKKDQPRAQQLLLDLVGKP
jgi:HEAT repeat protein/TolA-binding protein